MYKISIRPEEVQQSLSQHVLADGFDMTYDIEKSHGVYLYDSKRKRELLDFFTCFASVPLGYNHPKMMDDKSFEKNLLLAALANPSNSDVYTTQYAEFVATFARIGIPSYLPHAFFIAGGGLAIENALKTAMDWKVQKNFQKGYREERGFKVIHFENAFHGRTGYTLSLTNTQLNKTKWYAKFDWPRISSPQINFPYSDANDEDLKQREAKAINQIKQAFIDHKDDICAIIIEPVQSEGGDNHFHQRFMEQLRQLADENEAMLIYDEVQTGVGLTGKFWCYEHFGPKARPDIIAFGKKMQVCGILVGERVDENPNNVFNVSSRINSTWGGNLVDMVRSTKILQIIQEDRLLEKTAETGVYLQQKLTELANEFPVVSNVRGKGLLAAFDFPSKEMRDTFLTRGFENNALFLGSGEKTVRFRPALIMEKGDIDKGAEIMRGVISNLTS